MLDSTIVLNPIFLRKGSTLAKQAEARESLLFLRGSNKCFGCIEQSIQGRIGYDSVRLESCSEMTEAETAETA